MHQLQTVELQLLKQLSEKENKCRSLSYPAELLDVRTLWQSEGYLSVVSFEQTVLQQLVRGSLES